VEAAIAAEEVGPSSPGEVENERPVGQCRTTSRATQQPAIGDANGVVETQVRTRT
jgi:hypothetical protein